MVMYQHTSNLNEIATASICFRGHLAQLSGSLR